MVYSFIELYEAYGEVLKLLGKYISPCVADDLEYENGNVKIRVTRELPGWAYYVISYSIGGGLITVAHGVLRYGDGVYASTQIRFFDNKLSSVVYCGDCDEINFVANKDLFKRETYKLDYPLKEEQYFQRLTQQDLPSEEWIERVMYNSQYIFDGCNFNSFFFAPIHDNYEQFGTDLDGMIQHVLDTTKGLISVERERIQIQGS